MANEGGVRELQKAVLTMSRRYNSQAIEAATTSQKFTNQDQDLEQGLSSCGLVNPRLSSICLM